MKKVIITGATSFIGVHLVKKCLDSKYEVYALMRPNSVHANRLRHNGRLHIVELDMDEYDKLPQILQSADLFYHLAWEGTRYPKRDDCELQKHNHRCAIEAMKTAEKLKCKSFIGVGSQAEYGRVNGMITENHPCNPQTAYGMEKLRTCNELAIMASELEIRYIWARIFSVYGKFDYEKTFIMMLLEKMKKDETIEMTECIHFWDYIHVEDVTNALTLLAESDCSSGIYNIASGDYKELKKFVEIIKDITKSKSDLKYGAITYDVSNYINMLPNIDKIKSVGWEPRITFEDGIKKLWSEVCDHV